MFVGHYSAAYAARGVLPRLPLWHLFFAVQLVDFVWAGLIMAGVEKVRIIPHFMEASNLDLHYMPYTHSLPGSLAWAIGGGIVYALLWKANGKWKAGLIFGAAVFSHWLLDLIVHAEDLELYPGGEKVGFGLWRSLVWSQALEIGLLVAGFVVYLIYTQPKGLMGRISPWLLLVFLMMIQAYSHVPVEVPPSPMNFAITALFAYTLLTALAFLADRTRVNR